MNSIHVKAILKRICTLLDCRIVCHTISDILNSFKIQDTHSFIPFFFVSIFDDIVTLNSYKIIIFDATRMKRIIETWPRSMLSYPGNWQTIYFDIAKYLISPIAQATCTWNATWFWECRKLVGHFYMLRPENCEL